MRFNELAQRSGFSDFIKNTGVETDASGFLALITKWFVRLLARIMHQPNTDCTPGGGRGEAIRPEGSV